MKKDVKSSLFMKKECFTYLKIFKNARKGESKNNGAAAERKEDRKRCKAQILQKGQIYTDTDTGVYKGPISLPPGEMN